MRIELKYRKVCDECKNHYIENGIEHHTDWKNDLIIGKCPDCHGLGYTKETMEFSYNSE